MGIQFKYVQTLYSYIIRMNVEYGHPVFMYIIYFNTTCETLKNVKLAPQTCLILPYTFGRLLFSGYISNIIYIQVPTRQTCKITVLPAVESHIHAVSLQKSTKYYYIILLNKVIPPPLRPHYRSSLSHYTLSLSPTDVCVNSYMRCGIFVF